MLDGNEPGVTSEYLEEGWDARRRRIVLLLVHENLCEAEPGVDDVYLVETADDRVATEGKWHQGGDPNGPTVMEEDERVADPEADSEPQEADEYSAQCGVVGERGASAVST